VKITIIGDVHSEYEAYINITKNAEYSIQLGDMGWPYYYLNDVDPNKHKIIGGNHDNYDLIKTGLYPHFLEDFGLLGNDIFYVRGAFSIDKKYRLIGVDWWEEEELSRQECENCFEFYKKFKPNIVLSHDCPLEIGRLVGDPEKLIKWGFDNINTFTTRTSELLQRCFEYHQPYRWFFGHWHKSWNKVVNNTHFQCLNFVETFELII
jgi:hypothetical protein